MPIVRVDFWEGVSVDWGVGGEPASEKLKDVGCCLKGSGRFPIRSGMTKGKLGTINDMEGGITWKPQREKNVTKF
jgi:hypothetical protein